MATREQICNLALLRFGNVSIKSISEGTPQANACNELWDILVDQMLACHPWNFATKRAALTQDTDTPAFEYAYQYELPSDCIRILELYGSSATWIKEGDYLMTDDEEANIRYIFRQDEPAKFPPWFAGILATRMAAELAPKLKGDKNARAAIMAELKNELLEAFMQDAVEGKPARTDGDKEYGAQDFTWLTEGRS